MLILVVNDYMAFHGVWCKPPKNERKWIEILWCKTPKLILHGLKFCDKKNKI